VGDYYTSTLKIYTWLSKDHIHHGLWNDTTKDYDEAVLNTTKLIVDCLDIQDGDVVLDAGCGVGGTVRYIASQYDVRIIGITISEGHLKKAREYAEKIDKKAFLEFYNQDFTQTTFPNEYFNKAFALESSSHVSNSEKVDFVQEMHRILKPGGILVVLDGVQIIFDLSEEEKSLYYGFLNGWTLAEFDTQEGFKEKLKQAGFKKVQYIDKKKEVMKTSIMIYKMGRKAYYFTKILSKLRIVPKTWHDTVISCCNQKICLDRGIGSYGVFIAEK
jgi:cyclopropane fatty-acyl-phospholipid synthase-like methyltransferase